MADKRALRLILALAVLASFLPATPLTHAQGTPPAQIRIFPAAIEIPVNEAREVAVEAVDVQALYGIDISLTFDPRAVEVVDADPGSDGVQVALGNFLDPGFVVINKADNLVGTARVVMTQLNPSLPKNGAGLLIVVNLRGKISGASAALTLTRVDLARRDGAVFTGALVAGQVQVVAGSSGPAPTPFPKQGAVTPAPPTATVSAPSPATASPAATRPASTIAPTPVVPPTPTGAPTAPPAAAAVPRATVPVVAAPEVTIVQPAATSLEDVLLIVAIGGFLGATVLLLVAVVLLLRKPARRR
jgi:hypothetical protein